MSTATSTPTLPGLADVASPVTRAEWLGADPNASAAKNTAAIQAALNTGGWVTITKPGTYAIAKGTDATALALNACLHVGSHTRLTLGPGVTLRRANGANCYMLRNGDPTGGNVDITIEGGTWAGNSANNATDSNWFGHAIWLDKVDRLLIRDVAGTDHLKYVYWLSAVRYFCCVNLYFNTLSDGVHIGGKSYDGLVSHITGTTGDNTVALVTTEGTYYPSHVSGDIQRVAVENVSVTDCAEPVRLTGMAPDTIADVTIRGIRGSLKAAAVCAVNLTDDVVGLLSGCVMRRILVEDVDMTGGTTGGAAVQVTSLTADEVTIRNVQMRGKPGVLINGVHRRVAVDNVVNDGAVNADAIIVSGTVTNLVLGDVHQRLPTGGTAQGLNVTGTVTRLVHRGDLHYYGASGTGAAVYLNGGRVVDGRLGHVLCDTATYAFRSGATTTSIFRADSLRLKDTTYAISASTGGVIVDLQSYQLEGTSTGRTQAGTTGIAKLHAAPQWIACRVSYTDIATASSTNSAALATLPRGAVVQGVRVKHQQAFAGGAINALTVSVGIIGTTTKYSTAFDVFQATGFGVQQLSTTPGLAATNANEAVRAFFTATGANLNALTAGIVDVELLVSVAALNN